MRKIKNLFGIFSLMLSVILLGFGTVSYADEEDVEVKIVYSDDCFELNEEGILIATPAGDSDELDGTALPSKYRDEVYELYIEEGFTSIGGFCDYSLMYFADIPDTVSDIKDEAFKGCASLAEITIPDSVTYLGKAAFFNCGSLCDVELCDGIEEILAKTFMGCSDLVSIVIPESVNEIDATAFDKCDDLSIITLNSNFENSKTITSLWKKLTNLSEVYVPCTFPDDKLVNIVSSAEIIREHDELEFVAAKEATSKKEGNKAHYTCPVCERFYWDEEAKEEATIDEIVIPKVGTKALLKVVVADSVYSFSGKLIEPAIKVYDSNNKVVPSSGYSVTYKDNKKIGKATVMVVGKGKYSGTKTATFNIVPKTTKIASASLTKNKKSVTVKWNKVAGVNGYELQYSTDSKFKDKVTTVKVTNATSMSKTFTKPSGKKYVYIRVRSYKTVSGENFYSEWTSVKKLKIK